MQSPLNLHLVAALFLLQPTLAFSFDKKTAGEKEIQIIKKIGFSDKHVGFVLWDLEKKKLVAYHEPYKPFIPASVTKVPSTLYALEKLGKDFRFETKLGYSGKIKNGRLKGNIYIKGTGDPFLTQNQIFNFAQELLASGIKVVDGKFFYDDYLFAPIEILDPGGEKDKGYNPGMSALSSEFNRFFVWREGRSKRTARSSFSPIPRVDSISLEKTDEIFPRGSRFVMDPTSSVEKWKLSNRIRYGRREELPIRKPSIHTANVFRLFADQLGMILPYPQRGKYEADTEVKIQKGREVVELVRSALEYSNNVLTELLLLRAALKQKDEDRISIRGAAELLENWMKNILPEKSRKTLVIENGSGMTPKNKISPFQIVKILEYGAEKSFGQRSFWSLLSISGWRGKLFNRLHDPSTALRVWAKTGSLDYASGFAGYLISQKRRRYAFAVFLTDFERRAKLDAGNATEAHRLRTRAMKWRHRAQNVQNKLVHHWVNHR